MDAACANNTAGLEELLKRPLNPNVKLEQGNPGMAAMTALHRAAEHGHIETMLLLLEARAEIHADALGIIGGGKAPLHLAARNGHLEAVHVLIEDGAQKDQTDNAE